MPLHLRYKHFYHIAILFIILPTEEINSQQFVHGFTYNSNSTFFDYHILNLDQDIQNEIVVADYLNNDIRYFNIENESLSDPNILISNITNVRSFTFGDFNEDGLSDIFVSRWLESIILVYVQDENGEYQYYNSFETNEFYIKNVYWFDINLDGTSDLIIEWVGNAGINNSTSVGFIPFHDNLPLSDLITIENNVQYFGLLTPENDNMKAYLKFDEGVLLLHNSTQNVYIDFNSFDIADIVFEDINRDNLIDIVTYTDSTKEIAWFENLGALSSQVQFSPPVTLMHDIILTKLEGVKDFDGNGTLDLLYWNNDGKLVFNKILSNDSHIYEELDINFTEDYIEVIDINLDNDLDIFVRSSNFYTSFHSYLNGDFIPESIFEIQTSKNCYYNSYEIQVINLSNCSFIDTEVSWIFDIESSYNSIDCQHNFSDYGAKEIHLVLCNVYGCDTMSQSILLTHFGDFSNYDKILSNELVHFTNSNTGFTNFTWLFGDGNQSLEAEPTHVYTEPGDYEVTVILTNNEIEDCTFTETYNITVVEGTNIEEIHNNAIEIYPNPMKDICVINWNNEGFLSYKLQIIDLSGIVVYEDLVMNLDHYEFENEGLTSGMYFVKVASEMKTLVAKLMIK